MSDKLTVVQKLEALEAKVTSLTNDLAAANAKVTDLEGKLVTANQSATDANTALAEANRLLGEAKVALTKAESDLKAEKAQHDELKAKFDAEVTKQVSAKTAQIVASQHLPPVATAVNDKPGKTEPKQELTGMARIAAQFEKEIAGK